MNLAGAFTISLGLLTPGIAVAQEANALGHWTPYFRDGQLFDGDAVVTSGKITFDNRLTLKLGSPVEVIPKYRLFSQRVRVTAYPVSGDATRIILRQNYPICRGEQPKWIVFSMSYNRNENRNEMTVVLSLEDPRHPTEPAIITAVAEKACAVIAYIPGSMAQMKEEG